jgi:hypothetical protein
MKTKTSIRIARFTGMLAVFTAIALIWATYAFVGFCALYRVVSRVQITKGVPK